LKRKLTKFRNNPGHGWPKQKEENKMDEVTKRMETRADAIAFYQEKGCGAERIYALLCVDKLLTNLEKIKVDLLEGKLPHISSILGMDIMELSREVQYTRSMEKIKRELSVS
jgi:hypothetical protein